MSAHSGYDGGYEDGWNAALEWVGLDPDADVSPDTYRGIVQQQMQPDGGETPRESAHGASQDASPET